MVALVVFDHEHSTLLIYSTKVLSLCQCFPILFMQKKYYIPNFIRLLYFKGVHLHPVAQI